MPGPHAVARSEQGVLAERMSFARKGIRPAMKSSRRTRGALRMPALALTIATLAGVGCSNTGEIRYPRPIEHITAWMRHDPITPDEREAIAANGYDPYSLHFSKPVRPASGGAAAPEAKPDATKPKPTRGTEAAPADDTGMPALEGPSAALDRTADPIALRRAQENATRRGPELGLAAVARARTPEAAETTQHTGKPDLSLARASTRGGRAQDRTGDPDAAAAEVIRASRAKLETITNYQTDVNRQERVGGVMPAAEDVVLSIRRKPRAVRIAWLEGTHKGREVLYSSTEGHGQLHVNMADSLVPVPRLSMAPDSPIALRSSRHPITEAGFDTIVGNLENALKPGHPGGKAVYHGLEQPNQLTKACHKITRKAVSGELWSVYIDPDTKLPALVQAENPDGTLAERDVFRNIKLDLPELARADAFDVDKRWSTSGGMLARLARAAARVESNAAPVTPAGTVP